MSQVILSIIFESKFDAKKFNLVSANEIAEIKYLNEFRGIGAFFSSYSSALTSSARKILIEINNQF
jgi:hypothetical protein